MIDFLRFLTLISVSVLFLLSVTITYSLGEIAEVTSANIQLVSVIFTSNVLSFIVNTSSKFPF